MVQHDSKPPSLEALIASANVQTPLKPTVKTRKNGKQKALKKKTKEPNTKKKTLKKFAEKKTPKTPAKAREPQADQTPAVKFISKSMYQRQGWISQIRNVQERRVICQVTEKNASQTLSSVRNLGSSWQRCSTKGSRS